MNARQKAKHYKKLYERLQQQQVKFQVQNLKTHIIKAKIKVPYKMAYELTDNQQESEYMEVIKNKLSHEIAMELKERMNIDIIDYPPECVYKVYGSVRVVTGIYY